MILTFSAYDKNWNYSIFLISSSKVNINNNKVVDAEDNDSINIVNLVAVGDNLIHNSVLKSLIGTHPHVLQPIEWIID